MSPSLHALMESGRLAPLAYYFARFVARGCGATEDGVVALSAALVSARNLDGDVCIDLVEHAGRLLFVEGLIANGGADANGPFAPALTDWLAALRACPWVGAPGEQAPLILDGRRDGAGHDQGDGWRLYLGKYWHFEAAVAAALRARSAPAADLDPARLAAGLERLFPSASAADAAAHAPGQPDWQRVAAAIAVTRRFAVISGGPGTGKTTTVVKVLALLLEQEPRLRIALAAPTGKAAARLTESIGAGKRRIAAERGTDEQVLSRIPEQARTIHRLLGYGPDGRFQRNAENPLPVDCLVVDEASMIDLPLMAQLLAALPGAARLVLLGDRDQLASVEAGNVLGDITGRGQPIRYGPDESQRLAEVGAAPAELLAAAVGTVYGPSASTDAAETPPIAAGVALLRVSWRFGADSGIGALARAINAGDGALALSLLDAGGYPEIARLEPSASALHPACLEWAVQRFAPVADAAGPEAALDLLDRARVLAALHRGPCGVETLNARIIAALDARGQVGGVAGAEGLGHGMPIMITANDYEVGLYNGDVGLLWDDARLDERAGRLRAYFRAADGGLRSFSVRQLPPHVCAYALTVHKSQGSELDEVLLVLPPEPHPLATRELLYTAVTRARRQVTVHASRAALRQACAIRVQRTSALAERLGWSTTAPSKKVNES